MKDKICIELILLENPIISPENIQKKICETWGRFVPLYTIYKYFGGWEEQPERKVEEDYEYETRKIAYGIKDYEMFM